MNQDKMHLINKIFNNETIRTVWDKEDEKYYISVVDMHSITVRQDPQELRRRCMEFLSVFLACGLDPEKNIMYFMLIMIFMNLVLLK